MINFEFITPVLEALGKINTLIELYLSNEAFLSDVYNVNVILYLNNLECLNLNGIEITDNNFLIYLAKNCKKLTEFKFYYGLDVSDIRIMPLTKMDNLKTLGITTICENKNITSISLSEFKNIKQFECIRNNNLSDFAIIKIIKNSPNLDFLNVRCTSVTSKIIREAVALVRSRRGDTVLKSRASRNNFNEELLKRPEYQSPLLEIEYCDKE